MRNFILFFLFMAFANVASAQCSECPTPVITDVVYLGDGFYEFFYDIEHADCIYTITYNGFWDACTTTGSSTWPILYDPEVNSRIVWQGSTSGNNDRRGNFTITLTTNCTRSCFKGECPEQSASDSFTYVISTCDCDLLSVEESCEEICFSLDEHEFDCVGVEIQYRQGDGAVQNAYISSNGEATELCIERVPNTEFWYRSKLDQDCDQSSPGMRNICPRGRFESCCATTDPPDISLQCNEELGLACLVVDGVWWHDMPATLDYCPPVSCYTFDRAGETVEYTFCEFGEDVDCESAEGCCWTYILTIPDCEEHDPCLEGPSPIWDCQDDGSACLIYDQSVFGIYGPACWNQAVGDPTPVEFYLLDDPACTYPFNNLTMPACEGSPCGTPPSIDWECQEDGSACLIFDQSIYGIYGPACWDQAVGDPTPVTFYELANTQCTYPFQNLTMPNCTVTPPPCQNELALSCYEGFPCLHINGVPAYQVADLYNIQGGQTCLDPQLAGGTVSFLVTQLDNPDCHAQSNFIIPNCGEFNGGLDDRENNNHQNTTSIPSLEDIVIFPNPAGDRIFLEHSYKENAEFEIINLDGKVMKRGGLENSEKVLIDITSLNSGIYFIKLTDRSNQSVRTEKLLKK